MLKTICIYAALTSCLWVLFRWYIRRICSTISSDTCGEQSKIKEIFCFFSTLFRSFNILHSRKPNVNMILLDVITPRKYFSLNLKKVVIIFDLLIDMVRHSNVDVAEQQNVSNWCTIFSYFGQFIHQLDQDLFLNWFNSCEHSESLKYNLST